MPMHERLMGLMRMTCSEFVSSSRFSAADLPAPVRPTKKQRGSVRDSIPDSRSLRRRRPRASSLSASAASPPRLKALRSGVRFAANRISSRRKPGSFRQTTRRVWRTASSKSTGLVRMLVLRGAVSGAVGPIRGRAEDRFSAGQAACRLGRRSPPRLRPRWWYHALSVGSQALPGAVRR